MMQRDSIPSSSEPLIQDADTDVNMPPSVPAAQEDPLNHATHMASPPAPVAPSPSTADGSNGPDPYGTGRTSAASPADELPTPQGAASQHGPDHADGPGSPERTESNGVGSSPERTQPPADGNADADEAAAPQAKTRKTRPNRADATRQAGTPNKSERQKAVEKPKPATSLALREELDQTFEAFAWEEIARVKKSDENSTEMVVDCFKLTSIKTWADLEKGVNSLGFDLKAEESKPWCTLGIVDTVESIDSNSSNLLRSRLMTLRAFTQPDAVRDLPELDRKQADAMHKQIKKIEVRAYARLNELKKEKAKKDGNATPQWLEPSPELGKFLDEMAVERTGKGQRTTCMLNLSRLQGEAASALLANTASIDDTRHFYNQVLQGNQFNDAINAYKRQTIIMWAPGDQRDIDYIHRGLSEARKKGFEITFIFVVPFQALPCSWENAMPFIRNPFSGKKWEPYVTATTFLAGATRCVFSGAIGPLHQLRDIALYHVETVIDTSPGTEAFRGSSVMTWRSELAKIEEYPYIIADFAAEDAKKTEYILSTTQYEGLIGWSPTSNARGSSKSLRRKQMTGYFEQGTSIIHLNMAIRSLKSNDSLVHCMLATHAIFDDEMALIADVNDSRALMATLKLMEQCAMVTPRKALITTKEPEGIWGPEITEKAKVHRALTVSSLAHRNGQLFAKPAELPNIARTRGHAEERNEDPDLFLHDPYGTTTIGFDGAPSLLPDKDAKLLIDKITERLGVAVETVAGDPYAPIPDNTLNTIRIVTDHRGYWNGRLKLTLNGTPSHADAYSKINGSILKVGRNQLVAEVSHSFILPHGPGATGTVKKETNIFIGEEQPKLKCALRNEDPHSACSMMPCPICDAPGGDRDRTADMP